MDFDHVLQYPSGWILSKRWGKRDQVRSQLFHLFISIVKVHTSLH